MACKTSYALSHNFPRLATDSGFSFNSHRPRIVLDWNRIRSLDVEGLIKERNFQLIEQHINDVVECTLESEFDVRILDVGVVKLLRLAQLAVEYQQFCRQYLDRSVVVLRDELSAAMQELEKIRKEIRNKDEEIRKLRRKNKGVHRTSLPYGHENIATMILRTLSNRGDVIPGTSIGEAVPQYNKCQYCDKVFLNQLYLQSHLSRRHIGLNDNRAMAPKDMPERLSPQHDVNSNQYETELERLRKEVVTLQDKLRENELVVKSKTIENAALDNNSETSKEITKIRNSGQQKTDATTIVENTALDKSSETVKDITKINSTCIQKIGADENSNERMLIEKFEFWKNEENEKYRLEINELRSQLMENINLFKTNVKTTSTHTDTAVMEQIKTTVRNQEVQIKDLKEQLSQVQPPNVTSELEKLEETWRSRIEQMEKQHEQKHDQLLRTLETLYKEVKAAREIAENERAKVAKLEIMLQKKDNIIRNLQLKSDEIKEKTRESMNGNEKTNLLQFTTKRTASQTVDNTANQGTLDELHRRAQELLSRNLNSDSDTTDSPDELSKLPSKTNKKKIVRKSTFNKNESSNASKTSVAKVRKNKKKIEHREKPDHRVSSGDSHDSPKKVQNATRKYSDKSKRRSESESGVDLEEDTNVISSPKKVIRAKLSEEVNSRLLQLGVEPLRSGVPSETYQQRQTVLQNNADIKAKKDATYGKMRNRIISYLDLKVSKEAEKSETTAKSSPNKEQRNFKVSSIFSTVKHRAMTFMKSSEKITNVERNTLNKDIATRAAQLLKTPPGSGPTSPVHHRRASLDSKVLFADTMKKVLTRMASKESPLKKAPSKSQSVEVLHEKDGEIKVDIHSEYTDSDETSSLDFIKGHKKKSSAVKVVTSAIAHEPSKSIENLIKSPIRKPNGDRIVTAYTPSIKSLDVSKHFAAHSLARPASTTPVLTNPRMYDIGTDSDGSEVNIPDNNSRKYVSEENLLTRSSPTSTKGVLKNAPSISSLSKKKVLFDLEANQMKSVSASPSQSVTDGNEEPKADVNNAIINLTNDWEISRIEEALEKETKIEETITLDTRRSPKIADLTQRIESQLARREVKKPVGAIEVMSQNPSPSVLMDGSNTSVGSSMLDDSNEFDNEKILQGRLKTPTPAPRFVAKPRDKEASDLDVSDWSIDEILKEK